MLRNIPIKRKLRIIVMLTSGAALLLTCLSFIVYELVTFRASMVSDLTVTADMVGSTCSAALSFADPDSAAETLKFLQADRDVIGGAVYDHKGKLFATYKRAGSNNAFHPPKVEPDGHRFTGESLQLFKGITLARENVGTVFILQDLNEMYGRLWHYGLIASIVMLVAFFVAFLLSIKLQRVISGPVSHLAGVVNVVITEKNYSVRAVKRGEDELGRLIDAFNEMLNMIQVRDSALQEARNDLEKRVAERTVALSQANGELRDSAARFHTVWESAYDAMRLLDENGVVVAVNAAFCRLFGMKREELEGAPFAVAYAGDRDPAELQKRFRERLRTNQILPHSERSMVLRDGRMVELEIASTLIELPGRPALVLGLFRDITDRKRAAAELEQTHRQLLETSRQAGMAEVATGVLHNVGNVLNSVNISTTLVAEQIKKSKVANLAKATALMNEHTADLSEFLTNDPKGKRLPGYLTQLAGHLANEQTTLLKEIEQLRKNVEHIKDIVAMQQGYAKISGVPETLKISDLVEDALRMNAVAVTRHEVEVVREFAELPPVTIDKHKVLQILVNLIRNARYTCDHSGRLDKRLTVRAANDEGRLKIAVIDNGVGIPAENLIRIFNHGFTTKKNGHGFGLHSGALAANEMGGCLTVHSDGPGCGARFTLELPLSANSNYAN